MRLSEQIRPISYFKDNAAKAITEMTETHEPLIIIVSTPKEARLTIIRPGKNAIPTVSINGAPMTQVSGSKDWLYIRLPPGTHTIDYGTN